MLGGQSTFANVVETLLQTFTAEDLYVSTKQRFIKYVSDQAPQIPLRNYIVEPNAVRDRGPADGLAVLRLSVAHPGEPFFFVQSDCLRQPADAFLKMIHDAATIVARDRRLVTGGIKATEPNLGADYLKLGAKLHEDTGQEVYAVDEFIYRGTSYQATRELVENFHVVAHANHYAWYPELFLDAYRRHHPSWHKALMSIRDTFGKPGEDAAIEHLYAGMDKAPTEEVTKHIFSDSRVILLPFRWTDFGTWGSMYEFFASGPGALYKDGNVITVDATDSLVKVSRPDKLVALAGVDNLVVVDTDDALLIIPKTKIEKIKDIQKLLADHPSDRRYL